MCSYQRLFQHNNIGYVVCCNECENIHFGFGNFLFTVNAEEFDHFRRRLNKNMNEQSKELRTHFVVSSYPHPVSIKLLLSLRELRELERMREETVTELQSSFFANLFNNQENINNQMWKVPIHSWGILD